MAGEIPNPRVVVLRVMDGNQKQHAMRIYNVRN